MSGILGGKTISQSATKIEAFKLQSSAFGVAMTLLYGLTRVPGNLLWYGGFKAVPHTTESGGKGGVKIQNTDYTYTACVMMGLCEGQITGVTRAWKGKQLFEGGVTPSQLVSATETYTVSGGGTFTVAHAATFAAPGAVFTSVGSGQDAIVTVYAEGVDYTRVGGAYNFSSLPGGTTVYVTYQYTTGGASQTALQALGLSFASGALGQAPWSYLATYTPPDPPGGAAGSQSIGYSGLAYVYAQDYDLGTSAAVDNHTFEIQGPLAYSISSSVPDANPATFTADALTNGRYGAAMPAAFIGFDALWSTYCLAANLLMSPALTEQIKAAEFVDTVSRLTNTAPVWSGGQLKMVPYGDSSLTGNGVTFLANTTPAYDLGDADFIPDGGSPVRVERKSQADAYNHVRIEFLNRDNLYNPEIAEAKDSAAIDACGLRSADIVTAHWICDAAVARNVAQLLLQRSVYVRNTYQFTVPWTKALLEPMDLVTLTDAGLGLAGYPVRVTEVSEGDDGYLAVTAEDFPRGVASAAVYQTQACAGFQHDYAADPGDVLTPLIFEAPGALTQNGLEVWVAATGTGAKWGGCNVWVSMDGTNYRRGGTILGGSRYGTLTAGCGSSGGMSVLLNTGALASASASDATALNTLCYLCDAAGGAPEFVAFQTATLTSALHYNLGGTVPRGQYGTTAAARSAGAQWARCDDAIAKSGPIDLGFVGKTIHVKCTSFNIYGAGEQSLASVADYTYTVTGVQQLGNAGASALAQVQNIASDSILSPGEKPAVVRDYTVITAEQAGIDAQASAYGITTEKTTYDNAVSALTSYLGGLSGWNTIPGSDVAIVGATFRQKFTDVYAARQALLNKIDRSAGTVATWSGVSSRPANVAALTGTEQINNSLISLSGSSGTISLDGGSGGSAIGVVMPGNPITLGNVSTYLTGGAVGALNISLTGNIASGKASYGAGTGYIIEYNAGTPRLDIGSSTQYLRWDGTNLLVGGDIIASGNIVSSAVTTQASGTFSGVASNVSSGVSSKTSTVTIGSITTSSTGDGRVVLLLAATGTPADPNDFATPYLAKAAFSGNGYNTTFTWTLKRNGSAVRSRTTSYNTGSGTPALVDLPTTLFDTPGAGVACTYTYEMTTSQAGTTNMRHEILDGAFLLLELKR